MSAGLADPEAFVRSACALGPVPHVAGIVLHQASDAIALWQQAEDLAGAGQPPPFWAFAWPGGQALARYVLEHPQVVRGRAVLDIGSGSGLVAIAAAKAGAAAVVASEIDDHAIAAIRLNARANRVPVPAIAGDVLDGDGAGAQVVLAGDVWYSRELAGRVLALLERATARGACVLTGDIGRAFLPRHRLRAVDARDVPVTGGLEDSRVKRTMVWAPSWGPCLGP